MVQRLVLGALALLIVAWLGVAYRDARLQQQAREAIRDSEPRAVAAAAGELDDARLLNPDRSLLLDRGVQLATQGRRRAALERFTELARAEPENVNAWILIVRGAGGADPALAAGARARVRELDPRATR